MAYTYYDEDGNEIPESEVNSGGYDVEVVDSPPNNAGWLDVPVSSVKGAVGSLMNSAAGNYRFIEDAAKKLAAEYVFDTESNANPAVKLGAGLLKNVVSNSPEVEEYGIGDDVGGYASEFLQDVSRKYRFEPGSGSGFANLFGTQALAAAPAIVGGAFTGGATTVPMIGLQSFGANYNNAREEGQDFGTSVARGAGNAALDATVAKVAFNKFFRPELSPLRRYGESVATNVLTSPVQTIGNALINEATGAEPVPYEQLRVGENTASDALMGLFGPYVGGKISRGVNARAEAVNAEAEAARVDQLRQQMEAIAAEANKVDDLAPLVTEDVGASARIEEAARQAVPMEEPSLPARVTQEEPLIVTPEESRARTEDYQLELRARNQPSIIVDETGTPFNSEQPEASEVVRPFTQEGTVRKSLEEGEKAAIKELRYVENKRKEAERNMLPVLKKESTFTTAEASKGIDLKTFPVAREYVQKNMLDKGAQEGFINALKLQTDAWLNNPKGYLPSENFNATRRLEAAKTKGIQDKTMAIIKEISANREKQRKIEEQSYPTVIPPKEAKPIPSKVINSSSFPKVMKYVQKNMPDADSQKTFVEALSRSELRQRGFNDEATEQVRAEIERLRAKEQEPDYITMLRDIDPIWVDTPNLKLSKDIPNFKSGANERGVVDGNEIRSERYNQGTGPIIALRRNNGDLEVVTGRHRRDLAVRLGEPQLRVQILEESKGVTPEIAQRIDAEMNILDGQGDIRDYFNYFQGNRIQEGEASERGLLGRAKGRAGFDIATKAGDELVTLYKNKKISDLKAAAIARGAPNRPDVQAASLQERNAMTAEELEFFSKSLASRELPKNSSNIMGVGEDQPDLFGSFDRSVLDLTKDEAKVASAVIKNITQSINVAYDAAKKPELARKMGVDPKKPEQVLQKIKDLQVVREKWREHWKHPELKQAREEMLAELRAGREIVVKDVIKQQFDPTKRNRQRGAILFGKRKNDSDADPSRQNIPPRELVKTVVDNLNDKEIQRVVESVNSELDTIITEVETPAIEKKYKSGLFRGVRKGLSLPRELAKKLPQAREFVDVAEAGIKRQHQLVSQLANMAQPFMAVPANARMWSIAEAARLQGDSFKWTPDNFKRLDASDSEVEGLMALRNTMDYSLEIVRDNMIRDGVTPEQAQARVDELKRANYVPFTRFGDKYVEVRDAATGKQKYYGIFETEAQRQWILDKFKDTKGLIVTHGDVGETQDSLYQDTNSRGFSGHLKKAYNVPGYNKNLRRSVAEYISSLAYASARGDMKVGFEAAIKKLPPNMPTVGRELADFAKYQLSNDGEAAQWRKAITAMTIAGRVSSAALNLTQQLTTTLPKLVDQTNSFTKGTAEWVKAQGLLAQRVVDPEGFAKRNPELSAALDIAIKDGIITEAQFREMAAISSDKEGGTFDSVLNKSLILFDLAEKANKYQAFIGFYNVAKSKGFDAPTALKYAEDLVNDTQFVYGKSNTPKWFRGSSGAVIGQYKKFFLNDLALYSNLATGAVKGDSGAAKGLITKMAAMVALGGLSNMAPGLRDLDKLLMAMGIDSKQELRELFKDNQFAADFSTNGLLYALGLPDISQAVGNEILDLPDRYDNDSLPATLGKLVGGVSVGVAQKGLNAIQLAADGEYMKAAQQPVAGLAGPLRAVETMLNPERGITNNRGDTMVPDVTKGEIVSLFGGFNPARNRRAQDDLRSATRFGAKVSDNENINERLAEAVVSKEGLSPIIRSYYEAQSKKPASARRPINWTSVNEIVKRKRNPLQAKIDSMPKSARAEALKKFGKYSENRM